MRDVRGYVALAAAVKWSHPSQVGDAYTCWGGELDELGRVAPAARVVTLEARAMRPGPRERTTACTRPTSARGRRHAGTPLGTRCPFRPAHAPLEVDIPSRRVRA
jgi:hypothetical protein